jgi:hypothetical protein
MHSRPVLKEPNFFFLGLATLGLGKGCNVLVGESRRKSVSFFPFGTSKTMNLTSPQSDFSKLYETISKMTLRNNPISQN